MTDPRIEELDRQFNAPGSTMHLKEYQFKRAEFQSSPPPKVERAPAAAAPAPGVHMPTMQRVFSVMPKALQPLIDTVKKHAKTLKENEALKERLATVEFRLAALMGLVAEFSPNQKLSDVTSFALKIGELQKRIGELESKNLEYRGIWDAKESYPAGSFVTHAGSVWHAAIATKAVRPGDGNCWKLAVKRGKDAR